MKRIAAAALVACLMSATSALAQQDDHHGDRNNGQPHADRGGAPRGAGATHGGVAPQAVAPQAFVGRPGGNGHPSGVGAPAFVHQQGGQPGGFNPQAQSFHRNGVQAGVGVQGGVTSQAFVGHSGGQNHFNPAGGQNHFNPAGGQNHFNSNFGAPGFHPGGERPRYSAQFFPHSFNSGARFHWRSGSWNGPRGYYYRPWFYGQILPFGWFAPEWYISDYYDYELPVPPYGYEWVRNGPDALLVNIDNGMVVEDVPGIFY